MSCNIISFKVKKMNDLIIPLDALKSDKYPDWSAKDPVLLDSLLNKVSIDMGCDQQILGVIPSSSGKIAVTDLKLKGEGSGALLEYMFKDALRKSTGYLEAILVWQTGEIERMVVLDGQVSTAPIAEVEF
jgi:hypothetical protein